MNNALHDRCSNGCKLLQDNLSDISDGYHTFNELYDIRLAYNVALFNMLYNMDNSNKYTIFKAKKHFDGTMWDNYFIVVGILPVYDSNNKITYKQISNHYDIKHWNKFKIPSYETSPIEYDGHTTQNCIDTLINLV